MIAKNSIDEYALQSIFKETQQCYATKQSLLHNHNKRPFIHLTLINAQNILN